VAPAATQGATFEKHGGTDTRTVKDSKFFDIEDYPR
jgi:hypothetical protein